MVATRGHNESDDEREPVEDDVEWSSEATGDRTLQQQQGQQLLLLLQNEAIAQRNPSSDWSWGEFREVVPRNYQGGSPHNEPFINCGNIDTKCLGNM